jgi:hypothetical protein
LLHKSGLAMAYCSSTSGRTCRIQKNT